MRGGRRGLVRRAGGRASVGSSARRARRRLSESGTDRSELDVAEDDVGVGVVGLDVWGSTGGGGASSTGDTGRSGVRRNRVVRVEPEHLRFIIIPKRQNQYCPRLESAPYVSIEQA